MSAKSAKSGSCGEDSCKPDLLYAYFDTLMLLTDLHKFIPLAVSNVTLQQNHSIHQTMQWKHAISNSHVQKRPVFHRLPEPKWAWLLVVYFSL